MQLRRLTTCLLTGAFVCLTAITLWAQADNGAAPVAAPQPAAESPAAESPPAVDGQLPLDDRQNALATRYQRFEKTLLQMAEYMRKTDPEKADLLIRAIAKSKSTRITQQMEQIARLLDDQAPQYGDAIARQEEVVGHLQALLKLLQSENAMDKNRKEQERIKDLLKDLRKVLDKERDVRAGTERREDADDLARKQAKVADEARRLVDKIDGQDAAKNGEPGEGKPGEGKPGEGKPGEGKPGEGKPGEGKPGEGKPGEGKPGEEKPGEAKPGEEEPGEGKPGEAKPGEGKPGEGKPGEGKPGEGKPGEGKPGEGKPGEGKPGEGKPGEGKPGEGKPGEGKPSEGKPGEGKPGEGKPGEGKPGEGKPGEGKPGEGKPSEGKPGEGKPGEGKPGEGKPGEGKPGEGKPGEGKPGESGSSDEGQQKTPGRDDIQKAIEKMERAIEELKKKKLENASGEEDEAIANLEKAKAKLEEILRQLREEERELLLAALEARFQKMLIMQKVVLAGTIGLDKTPKDDWQPRHEGRSRELAVGEDEIALEAAKALTLLKEEGSSVAFPEAVEQLREDMLTVAGRLREYEVGELTQGIEKDIIEALEELIEALQKEMEKNEEKKQQQQQQQQQQDQDPPLVDKLAELKMLRSLQLRINGRTRRLGRLIDGDQATEAEVVGQLQELSRRQQKIQQATYDLATGKNQ